MVVTLTLFYADWSNHSKLDDEIVQELEREWGDRLVVERIDVEEQQELTNERDVHSLPTLIVENDDGVVDRFDDVVSKAELERALKRAEFSGDRAN